jgi:hypothetical protein
MVIQDFCNESLWKDKMWIQHPAHDTTPDQKRLGS